MAGARGSFSLGDGMNAQDAARLAQELIESVEDDYERGLQRHGKNTRKLLSQVVGAMVADSRVEIRCAAPMCDACGWIGDVVPTIDEARAIVRAHLPHCDEARKLVLGATSNPESGGDGS